MIKKNKIQESCKRQRLSVCVCVCMCKKMILSRSEIIHAKSTRSTPCFHRFFVNSFSFLPLINTYPMECRRNASSTGNHASQAYTAVCAAKSGLHRSVCGISSTVSWSTRTTLRRSDTLVLFVYCPHHQDDAQIGTAGPRERTSARTLSRVSDPPSLSTFHSV